MSNKILSVIAFELLLLLFLAAFFITAHAGEFPDSPPSHLSTRHDPIETYSPDERMTVHNSPSHLHKNWISRHPHIFGILMIGAGAGIGAGISISQRRGICTKPYDGHAYYGTAPCPK